MKKLFCILLCTALFVPLLASCGGEKWDISAAGDGSVTATIKNSNGKRTLIVEGNGEMKNFQEGDRPWDPEAASIEAVEIKNGVRSVGENAFRGITVPYILLPESVALIGSGAAETGVKLFAENDAVTGDGADLYYYSESAPAGVDVYWQQDKSTGNVTDGLHSAEKRYFHYENDVPTAYNFYKVLFIGNSFTYRNGVSEPSGGVAKLFDGVAENLGAVCETYMIAGPGWHIKDHAESEDPCGKQVDLLLHAVDDFDYIVLQEHSTDSMDKREDFVSGIKGIQEKVAATQTRAEVVLYETWGSPASAKTRDTTVFDMEQDLRTTYELAAADCGIRKISYVGYAFSEIYRTHQSDKAYYLWDTDDRHQGLVGAYLSACVHVATLLELDPIDCTYVPDVPAPPAEEVLSVLHEAAQEAADYGAAAM